MTTAIGGNLTAKPDPVRVKSPPFETAPRKSGNQAE